ncbi:hypothetical protein BJ138DRAFT_1107308 [Hygrophoropsis aurantiaca]|uniref:Uncharacterized protein n=1 Tax=Hygrophoropsis aurantiaca TaxID=72124 RepID=A0ACB7ZS08_9AGAM|nr:hypothetical protein BJ138DRAFT_1107308 [Hygrophoropsis aurantiaca]
MLLATPEGHWSRLRATSQCKRVVLWSKDEIRIIAAEVWAKTRGGGLVDAGLDRMDGIGMVESELGRILVLPVEDDQTQGRPDQYPNQGYTDPDPLLPLALNTSYGMARGSAPVLSPSLWITTRVYTQSGTSTRSGMHLGLHPPTIYRLRTMPGRNDVRRAGSETSGESSADGYLLLNVYPRCWSRPSGDALKKTSDMDILRHNRLPMSSVSPLDLNSRQHEVMLYRSYLSRHYHYPLNVTPGSSTIFSNGRSFEGLNSFKDITSGAKNNIRIEARADLILTLAKKP